MFLKIIAGVFIFVNFFFLIAVIKKKFSVIDIGWGFGFILIALISYFHHPMSIKNAAILLAVTIWGLRLGLYILVRAKGHPEDPRYTKFRRQWEPNANLQAYFKVFLLQGTFMLIISLPVSVGMQQEDMDLQWFNYAGIVIWFAGLALEVTSDFYLLFFKKKPENKGKLCTTGPWKICRFPNYLGEVTLWYGIYFIALGRFSWWTIIGPAMINLLIIKVSGVAPQEEKQIKEKSPEYAEYARRTPRFLPFKTKKNTIPPWTRV